MPQQTGAVYEFGPYRLDLEGRVLSRGDRLVPLAPKSFELLRLLVLNPGRAFSKRELRGTLVRLEKRWWFGMALSPDERALLYSQVDDEGGNLMLVETFEAR